MDNDKSFCGFIWSPIFEYYFEIMNKINKSFVVEDFYIYEFDKDQDTYEKSILDIYTSDDIDPIKVKNVKIKCMKNYSHKYVYFKFKIKDPKFRVKKPYKSLISTVVENIKKDIRSEYKSKVSNYVHDVTIHIGDNYEQTYEISNIMKKYEKYKMLHFMNIKKFLQYQYHNDTFTRVDFLVRKYSIEQYLLDKNYDFYLYNKMQKLRGVSAKHGKKTFKELINSMEKSIDLKAVIEYENEYMLRNGSHRLSYYYLKKVSFVPISSLIDYKPEGLNFCNYSLKWFLGKFSNEEISIMKKELVLLESFLKE